MSSFHGQTITTTVNSLIKAIGQPIEENNTGEDKTNFEWEFKTNDFTAYIYDWKEYAPIGRNELIDFHIGTDTPMQSLIAKEELENLLS